MLGKENMKRYNLKFEIEKCNEQRLFRMVEHRKKEKRKILRESIDAKHLAIYICLK